MRSLFASAVLFTCSIFSALLLAESQCVLEDWRYHHEPILHLLTIEGATSCATGTIHIRVYEGEKFIGVATGFIEGFTFVADVMQVKQNPEKLSIKYTISKNTGLLNLFNRDEQ